jgi:hypothetical protein
MSRLWLAVLCSLACVWAAGCAEELDHANGVDGFQVTIQDGPEGSADDPIPFPEAPLRYVLNIYALDQMGNLVTSYNGKVALSLHPAGKLASGQPSRLEIAHGQVLVEACHGDVTIWVEDAGGLETKGVYALGATPVLHFADPTIAQMQRTDDIESSPLRGDFVELRAADREIVVTNVRRDGFYCQDLAEPDGAYAGVFVYTHNRPSDVELGSRVTALRGQVDEFFGFTELGFPDFAVDGTLDLPAPKLIDPTLLTDEFGMEALEGSLVTVEDVLVCPMDEQYTQYDQWRVLVNPASDCSDDTATILVAETAGLDDVDPPSLVGRTLTRVIGDLRYHYLATPSWMIIPRDASDVK